MGAYAGGDRDDDFRAFVSEQRRPLFSLALLLVGDRGLAEDLVQTAFVRTYARWDRLRTGDPTAYARRIVANENIDRWRRVRGREVLSEAPPDRIDPGTTDTVAERDAVIRALGELSDRERRVVVLRFLSDLSEADTASALGIPRGTVKSVTNRAVTKLRASRHLTGHDEVTA